MPGKWVMPWENFTFWCTICRRPASRIRCPGSMSLRDICSSMTRFWNSIRPEASPEVDYARRFIEKRRGWAPVLEQARRAGVVTERIIHGDPKVNNVLLDAGTGRAVSLIDLDTVKPGLVQYDLGDCLRSGCNPLGEETTDLARVRFELAFCRAILQGYLSQAREFLTPGDYDCMYDAIRLIAFELGLRFFTDYLAGDIYFKASRPRAQSGPGPHPVPADGKHCRPGDSYSYTYEGVALNSQPFALQPFTAGGPFAISGTISRRRTDLTITYNLTGPLNDLIIAPPADNPSRQWVLWEHTCFELFLAGQGAGDYWEWNLSPAGHWNVFRLNGYRQGIQEEPAFQALPFTVQRRPEALTSHSGH